jgi:hypothetical protein
MAQVTPADLTLEAVQQVMIDGSANQGAAAQSLEADAEALSSGSIAMADSIRTQGTADALVAKTEGLAALEAQNSTITVLKELITPDAQATRSARLNSEELELQDALDAEEAVLSQGGVLGFLKQAVNISAFGTPGGMASNRARAAEGQYNASVAAVQNVAAASESVAKAELSMVETLTADSINAASTSIMEQSTQAATEAELTGLRTNVTMTANILSASAAEVSGLVNAYKLPQAIETLNAQRTAQTAAADRLIKTERVDAAKTAVMKRGYGASGVPYPGDDVALWMLDDSRPTEIANQAAKFMQLGMSTASNSGASYGGNLYDAIDTMMVVDPSGVAKPTHYSEMAGAIQTNFNAEVAANPNIVLKDAEEYKQALNTYAETQMAGFEVNIKPGDASNPLVAAPMSVLGNVPAVKGSALYQNVPAIQALRESPDPAVIQDLSIAAVREGMVTVEEAVSGIQAIFGTAAMYNNSRDGGFQSIGLPSQTTYKSRIAIPKTGFQQLISNPIGAIRDGNLLTDSAVVIGGIANALSPVGVSNISILGDQSIFNMTPTDSVDFMDAADIRMSLVRKMSSLPRTEEVSE